MKLIVDSTCDLSKEIMEKFEIDVVPLRVSIGEVEFYDKITIQVDEVYREMRKGILPKTSQVSPIHFYEVFEKACEKGEDFIYLSFSRELSGTHDLGLSILNEFKEKYPNIKMEIIDSKSGTTAIGMIALDAIKLEQNGVGFEEIVEKTKENVKKIEHIFTLGDLKWLVKGGRISKVKGAVGTMLDIRPVLEMNDGKLEVMKSVRGKKRVIKTILDTLEIRGIRENNLVGISHADDVELMEEIKKGIIERFGEKEFIINKIGSVLGSHVGLTGVGVFIYNNSK